MTSDVDEDLVKILQNFSIKAEARLQGWEYILSLSGSDAGIKRLIAFEKYIPFILAYLKESNAEKGSMNLAYKSLINLSSSSEGSHAILAAEKDFVISLLNSICDATSDFIEAKCYILSNLSNHCDILDQDGVSSVFLDLWRKQLKCFFCSENREVRNRYKFFCLVLANISRVPEGRKLLLEDESFLGSLLLWANPDEPDIRRLGIALTIRNCCSETSSHKKLLEDLGVLPFLLLPLIGPEEFKIETMEKFPVECQYLESSKERENIPQIRKALVQALSLLCYSEEGWNYLKDKAVYAVALELHLWEKDQGVIEEIETLVEYLLVENYSSPSFNSIQTMDRSTLLIAEKTDLLLEIPDFVV